MTQDMTRKYPRFGVNVHQQEWAAWFLEGERVAKESNMDFGSALEALKHGHRVAREGWNGDRMFLYYVPGSQFKPNRHPLDAIVGDRMVEYRPHIDLMAADGTFGVWTASMTDILSEDWEIVE